MSLRQPDKLMLAGDWHGNLPWAFKAINYAKHEGVDTILHVGDFGFWPGDKGEQFLYEVTEELRDCGVEMYFVDGNHEWHPELNNAPGAAPLPLTSRITHLPRGYRWEWWGEFWMALGGAHSIDCRARTEGKDWWPEEILNDDQVEYASRPGPVDVIVAHDAPWGATIPGIDGGRKKKWNPQMFPPGEILRSEQHRKIVKQVVDDTMPLAFYHGHYHVAYQDAYRLPGGEEWCRIRGLDKDGATMGQNTLIITKGALDGI